MPNPSSSPPPAPATAATRQRLQRRRQLLPSGSGSGASASSSSSASSSGLSFSPAPSPFHHRFFLSPLRASAVPFSWEHRPGIPKTPARQQVARPGSGKAKAAAAALPLPPCLLSRKVGAADGPFSSAAADGYFIVPDDAKARQRRRRQRPPTLGTTLTDWLAVLSLYGSCTRSRDCLASTPPPHLRGQRRPAI